MAHWLFKSEPSKFSFADLKARGATGTEWDGVRNYLARNNMRTMQVGDQGFYYHSNEGLAVVGICEVVALSHPDSTSADPRWDCVDVRAVRDLKRPVTLAEIKTEPSLSKMSLVTSMRLSVQPVTDEEWEIVLAMAER